MLCLPAESGELMRVKKYEVGEDELCELFKTGVQHRMIRGLPAGAKLVYVEHVHVDRKVVFVFEHESFKDVGEGVPLLLDSEVSLIEFAAGFENVPFLAIAVGDPCPGCGEKVESVKHPVLEHIRAKVRENG